MPYGYDRDEWTEGSDTQENAILIGCRAIAKAIQEGLNDISVSLKDLGNGDAATSMGAIEAFGVVVKEGLAEIAVALDRLKRGE